MHMQLHIFLLAGVQTRDSFFISLTTRINQLLAQKGVSAHIQLLYPYGDYNRKMWKQVLDLCLDINIITKYTGIGGRRVKQQLEQCITEGKSKFLFIGHSGGGIAAYRIARYMYYKLNFDLDQLKIVQVGSPKIRVAAPFQSHTAYIQATDKEGNLKDPITRIGFWGGLEMNNAKKRNWNKHKYAPVSVYNVPLIGGHADYFRVSAPYIDEVNESNLDRTFTVIETWLKEWI